MGQPAYVNTGSIYFKDASDAKQSFEQIQEWVRNAMAGTLSNPDLNGGYGIYNLEETEHCWINFKAESGRVQNLEWQMKNLRDFIKTLDNVVAFEAPIMVESDAGIFWEVDEEELV